MPKVTKHSVLGTDVWVVDDVVSPPFQDFIKQDLDPMRMQVNLLRSSAYSDRVHIPSAGLTVYADNNFTHGAYWYLYPLLLEAAYAIGKQVKELHRIRVGVYFANGLGIETKNKGHFDSKTPHIIGLYYPHDGDGKTYVYEKENSEHVVFEMSPKQGRFLFMDGSLWHSSSNPTNPVLRTTVNFNFLFNDEVIA